MQCFFTCVFPWMGLARWLWAGRQCTVFLSHYDKTAREIWNTITWRHFRTAPGGNTPSQLGRAGWLARRLKITLMEMKTKVNTQWLLKLTVTRVSIKHLQIQTSAKPQLIAQAHTHTLAHACPHTHMHTNACAHTHMHTHWTGPL